MGNVSAGPRLTLLSAATATNSPPVAGTAAAQTLTLTGNAVAAETVTVGTTIYTWRAAVTSLANEVKIGATASDSLDNLIAAGNRAAGAGTTYGLQTAAHPSVTFAAGAGDTMVVTQRDAEYGATVGNAIATTETMTAGSWGAATLASGVDRAGVRLSGATATVPAPDAHPDDFDLLVTSAGTGALSYDAKLWGYGGGAWALMGSGANRAHINDGTAITGTTTTSLRRLVASIGAVERAYLEITAISGTGHAVTAYMIGHAG